MRIWADFFFLQAEDGIRDHKVTGVQTCALPISRPPISSVSRRRFSSIGDEPITIGRIFAAASAHDDVSVAEQPAFPCALCEGSRGSLAGGSCACKDGSEAKRQSGKEIREIVRPVMRWLSFPGFSMRCLVFRLQRIILKERTAGILLLDIFVFRSSASVSDLGGNPQRARLAPFR